VAWTEGEASGAAKVGGALLLYRDCCVVGVVAENYRSSTAAMVAGYHANICHGDRGDRGSSRCMTVGSLKVDRAVVNSVLTAIQPVGIEAALQMGECDQAEDNEKRKALELALERARYEANRARRQFDAVEPENRLVASELETRWNQALAQVAEVEARLVSIGQRPSPLSAEKKKALMTLAEDVTALWNHPKAPVQAEEADPTNGAGGNRRR